jgi:tetratricopeptide (TPR) repeat protein
MTRISINIFLVSLLTWFFVASLFSNSACASPEEDVDKLKNLFSTGQKFLQNGQYENALPILKEALKLSKKSGNNNLDNITILMVIGLAQRGLKKFERAIETFNQALEITEDASMETVHINLLNQLGNTFYDLSKYEEAINLLSKALKISRKLGNKVNIGYLLTEIGNSYMRMSKHVNAKEYFKEALVINRNLGKSQLVAIDLNGLGIIYLQEGRSKEAYSLFSEALKISRELGADLLSGETLRNISVIYIDQGQYDKGISILEESLEIFKKYEDDPSIALTYYLLGTAYLTIGKTGKSLQLLEQAQNIFTEKGNKEWIAAVIAKRGAVQYASGQLAEAQENFLKALNIFNSLHLKVRAARIINSLGLVFSARGEFDEALKNYQTAKNIFQRHHLELEVAGSLSYMGHVYAAWGQLEKAGNNYQKATRIYEKSGKKGELIRVLMSMGMLHIRLRNYSEAIENFQQGAVFSEEIGHDSQVAHSYAAIGHTYIRMEKYDKATNYLDKAQSIFRKNNNKLGIANILLGTSALLLMGGGNQETIQELNQALAIFKEQNIKPRIGEVLSMIGFQYYLNKNYEKAISLLAQSIDILETIRRTATGTARRDYMHKEVSKYRLLVSAYIRNKEYIKSLEAMEQSQARLLKENLSDTNFKISMPDLNVIQNKMDDSTAILVYSVPRISNFPIKMNPAIITVTKSNIFGQEIQEAKIFTPLMKQQGKSIERYVKNQRTMKIISLKNKPEDALQSLLTEVPREDHFRDLIGFYRTLIATPSNKNNDKIKQIGRGLFDLLIKPVEKNIADKKKLIIIPDGVTGLIPFEILIDEEGKYLVEKYDVTYAPSIQVLDFLDNRNLGDRKKTMLAFGGAIYDEITYDTDRIENNKQLIFLKKNTLFNLDVTRSIRDAYTSLGKGDWSNLPGTLDEVDAIAGIVKGTSVFTGSTVNEQNIKNMSENGELEKYKILHFATHGLTVPEFPELSAIVLSQFQEEQENQDGFLRVDEILKLKIKADFVNLSACETGLGKIYGGEGVVGLARSFLLAGANSVSASLWSVEDSSTSKFMVGVYQLVKEKGLTYAKAMNEMKRAFIRGQVSVDEFDLSRGIEIGNPTNAKPNKLSHPFYWAPFVYYGVN